MTTTVADAGLCDVPEFYMGLRPRSESRLASPAIGAHFKVFGQDPDHPEIEEIPEEKWEEVDLSDYLPPLIDQGPVNKCASTATTGLVRGARRIAGLDDVELADDNLYARVNGGRDQGSTILDNLIEAGRRGICRRSLVKPGDWRHGLPAGWEADADGFEILEAYDCPTTRKIASALQRRFLVTYGILVNPATFRPDADGYVPYFSERGGHGLLAFGMRRHPKTGLWYFGTQNSWKSWGIDGAGRAWVHRAYFDNSPFRDAFALRAVKIDPKTAPGPLPPAPSA